jgi:protein-tyrosine kinase
MDPETKKAGNPGQDSARLRPLSPQLEEHMIGLYQSLRSLLTEGQGKSVQLIEAQGDEGAQLLTRELAKAVAAKFKARVLLVDTDSQNAAYAKHFGVDLPGDWIQAAQDGRSVKDTVAQVGESRLFLSQIAAAGSSTASLYDSAKIEDFLGELAKEYDLILLNAPAESKSHDAFSMSYRVDGVVLVVEAEKTRFQVAQALKERVVKVGGNVIGVVLNKKRHHIPGFLYKRL